MIALESCSENRIGEREGETYSTRASPLDRGLHQRDRYLALVHAAEGRAVVDHLDCSLFRL